MMIKRNKRDQRSYLLTAAGAMALVVLCSMTSSMHAAQMPYQTPYDIASQQAETAGQVLREAEKRYWMAESEGDINKVKQRLRELQGVEDHANKMYRARRKAWSQDPKSVIERYETVQMERRRNEERLDRLKKEGVSGPEFDWLVRSVDRARKTEDDLLEAIRRYEEAGSRVEEIE